MSNLQERLVRGQIGIALRHMGAQNYEVLRTPRDPNGQPTGEPAEVIGQMYGMMYMDPALRQRIHIALPGVIASNNDAPSMVALKLCGETPQTGDVLRRNGKTTKVLSVILSGPVYTITAEEVI